MRYTFKILSGEIRSRRRLVGMVRPGPVSGGFVGRIGPHIATAATAEQAFCEVAALALGFGSAAELHQRNRAVRRQRRQNRYGSVTGELLRMLDARREVPASAAPVARIPGQGDW